MAPEEALATRRCKPCEGGTLPLRRQEAERLLAQVPGWALGDGEIHREYKLGDFRAALGFVDRVGKIAEAEDHHPDILLHDYRKVRITLSTHAIGGLSENDFIVAAKIDASPS